MALYLIQHLYDRPPDRRRAANIEHVAYLKRLAADGVVLAAGAIRDEGCGFVLVAADSVDHATVISTVDPLIVHDGASVQAPLEWLVDIACTGATALIESQQ